MTVPIYIPAIQKHLLFEITHLCRMVWSSKRHQLLMMGLGITFHKDPIRISVSVSLKSYHRHPCNHQNIVYHIFNGGREIQRPAPKYYGMCTNLPMSDDVIYFGMWGRSYYFAHQSGFLHVETIQKKNCFTVLISKIKLS